MTLRGFLYPRTSSGLSSLLPPPPWHYSGEMITVEFRTDPAKVAALLPPGLNLATDDPGAVAMIWADWQSCSDGYEELLDPVRSQYKETLVVVRCSWRDRTWSRCVYIWVDKDFALVRGQHQGYPKKMGEMWMTRPVSVGKAGPRLRAGAKLGATLTAAGRRLAEAVVTLEDTVDAPGFVNGHQMLHNRWVPAIESDGQDALSELVTMVGYDSEVGDVWRGTADLALFPAPTEELADLQPMEILAGYYHQVGVSWRAGSTLERT